MKNFRIKPLAAAAALLAMFGSAQADSFFWAVNQFQTIQNQL